MEPALAAPHPAEGLTLLAQSSYPLSAFSGLALAASDWSCSLAHPLSGPQAPALAGGPLPTFPAFPAPNT